MLGRTNSVGAVVFQPVEPAAPPPSSAAATTTPAPLAAPPPSRRQESASTADRLQFRAAGEAPRASALAEIDPEILKQAQARIRGHQARKIVSVTAVADTGGMVKVHLGGSQQDLARMGFERIDTTHGDKDLSYLAVPADKYTPHLAGGERLSDPTTMPPARLRELLARDRKDPAESTGPVAYINGSFYNNLLSPKASPDHDEAAAIGKNTVAGVKSPTPVPIPKIYKSDYHAVEFRNGSTLNTGPQLSRTTIGGKFEASFDDTRAQKDKYRFPADENIKPGDLQHVQHPNPRSAINFPAGVLKTTLGASTPKPGDAVRMLVARDASGKTGAESQGLTMAELSRVMTRLGKMNRKPGPSYNLDGGASSVTGVVSAAGHAAAPVDGRPGQAHQAANFVVMEKPKR